MLFEPRKLFLAELYQYVDERLLFVGQMLTRALLSRLVFILRHGGSVPELVQRTRRIAVSLDKSLTGLL